MLQFDDFGLLNPNEIIISNLEEFRNTFVFNQQRTALFDTYLDFLEDVKKLDLGSFFQWIDGSFVTRKPFPKDIDLVTFIDFKTHKLKNSRLQLLKETYKHYGIDVYFESYYPDSHPFHAKYLYQTDYWFKLYSSTKPLGQQQLIRRKGLVQINY
jgi:hypothetical protein